MEHTKSLSIDVLRNQVRSLLKKTYLLLKSVVVYLFFKTSIGAKVDLKVINSIKGRLCVEVLQYSYLSIGNFLMTAGPCYIKCVDHAKCRIGNNVFFNHNCSITCAEMIVIGDNCNIANNVVIVDHDHNIGKNGVIDGLNSQPVNIGNNVWIGANAVILKGTDIGDGAIIAAGAVVKGKIPAGEVWGGVPAKKIRAAKEQ